MSFHKSWDFLQAKWIFIGPIIHAIFTVVAFVIIPLTVIISMFVSSGDYDESMDTGGLYVYPISCFAILIQFVIQILPVFLGARNFSAKMQRQFR